jgi:hypothetical protein
MRTVWGASLGFVVLSCLAAACGDDAAEEDGAAAGSPDAAATASSGTAAGPAGSGGGDATGSTGVGGNYDGPTFYADVAYILRDNCVHCHTDGQIGGFSMEAYEDAAPLATLIVDMTSSGQMPPFNARETDDCGQRLPWKDDVRLGEEDLETLRLWAEAGAPAGDPADGPPPFELQPDELPGVSVTLTPSAPYPVEGEDDIFECVIYDPEFDADTILDGIHIVPTNTEVAHHALTFVMSRDEALERSGGDERFPCFGAPGDQLVHAWAPGGQPFDLPEGVGIKMTADDVLVVQMHYHPTGEPQEDNSAIQLRVTEDVPQWLFQVVLPGNASNEGQGLLPGPNDDGDPEFRIPANATDHVEEMTFTVPEIPGNFQIPILTVATHMHYVGVDMRLSIERANPTGDQLEEECLVRTPEWDFNWQRFYQFDVPIDELPTATSGDVFRMKCTYDNTKQNRFVKAALEAEGMSEPIDVQLGETTLDEMCLGPLGILVPNL